MKTVLKEIIDKLEEGQLSITTTDDYSSGYFYALSDAIRIVKNREEKEKQQLIDAGNSCAMKQYLHEHRVSEMTNEELLKFVEQKTDTFGEDYYNETFKNEIDL